MQLLDKKLAKTLKEAEKRSIRMRNVDGISTIDIFSQLVQEPESILYQYLSECKSDYEIFSKLNELNKKFAKNIKYAITLKVTVKKTMEIMDVDITERLWNYFNVANKLAKKMQREEVFAHDILTAIIQNPIKPIVNFLEELQVDISKFRKYLESTYYVTYEETTLEIPEIMKNYISTFSESEAILGREKEIDSAWNILSKKTKRNIILVGDPGVGKTAIVQKMVAQIKNGTAPEEFHGFNICSLDVTAIISGTKYRGDAEARFEELISFIKKNQNMILFIDEAHMILGAGSSEGNNIDLANALKSVLARDDSRIIAATTTREYDKYFSRDPATKRRFEKITVDEPTIYEVYPMIKAKIDELSNYHNVKISHRMVNFIALYSACFSYETKNPDRTLDLIDRSMVSAKRKNKSFVDEESVLSNFKVSIKLFKSIPKNQKRETAYHEAGHYIAFSFLPFLKKSIKPVVVSIYPAEDYIGITVTEKRPNVIATKNKRAYLERIAACLAGGIAEKIVNGGEPNDGVSADAENATQLAKFLVTQTGFYNDFFFNLNSLETDKSIECQVVEIKNVLEEARSIAEDVIKEHRNELNAVAEALLRKNVLSDEELKKVMKKAIVSGKKKELVLNNNTKS